MSVQTFAATAEVGRPDAASSHAGEAACIDVLLVVGYFRSATPYLSIVRHLSKDMQIGVVFADLDDSMQKKTGEAHDNFVALCRRFGARIFSVGEPVHARVMLVQQFLYSDEMVDRLRQSVRARRTVGMMTLASAGLERHDRFVLQFGITRAYAPDADFVHFLLARRQCAERYDGVEIVDVGLPFRRYPVFPEFAVDWLFVAPTLFSFTTETGKKDFLRTVLQAMEQIPREERIAYKPHNGNAVDYFAPRLYYALARPIVKMRLLERSLEWLSTRAPKAFGQRIDKLLASALHLRILRRAVPMRELTPDADISVEAFMPGIRKGLIGGHSNVIWGARHFRLPFLNCIDPAYRQGTSQLKPGATITLDINMEYFGLPYCGGRMVDPVGLPGKPDESLATDILCELRKDLA